MPISSNPAINAAADAAASGAAGAQARADFVNNADRQSVRDAAAARGVTADLPAASGARAFGPSEGVAQRAELSDAQSRLRHADAAAAERSAARREMFSAADEAGAAVQDRMQHDAAAREAAAEGLARNEGETEVFEGRASGPCGAERFGAGERLSAEQRAAIVQSADRKDARAAEAAANPRRDAQAARDAGVHAGAESRRRE